MRHTQSRLLIRAMPLLIAVASFTAVAAVAASADAPVPPPPPAPGHPFLMPRVTGATVFPACSDEELARHGYPDHQHEYFWPGWVPMVDDAGESYGYGTLCSGLHARDREGFVAESGYAKIGPFSIRLEVEAKPCYVAPFLGFCEMAQRDAADIFQLQPVGELSLLNPENVNRYTEMTGLGTWRMYALKGDEAIVQPVGILAQRTLIAHAARDLVTRWLLESNEGAGLPVWLKDGLASWSAEMGVHLCNYMAPYRPGGSVLLPPAAIDAVLTTPPDANDEADRRRFRTARYSAFLMAWRLVEHEGGLTPLRAFLAAVRDGDDPDAACNRIYGVDLAGLAERLDPRLHAEPVGAAVQPRNPARPPKAG